MMGDPVAARSSTDAGSGSRVVESQVRIAAKSWIVASSQPPAAVRLRRNGSSEMNHYT